MVRRAEVADPETNPAVQEETGREEHCARLREHAEALLDHLVPPIAAVAQYEPITWVGRIDRGLERSELRARPVLRVDDDRRLRGQTERGQQSHTHEETGEHA